MLEFRPLLAADWFEIAIVVFIMTSSLIGQLFKAAQKQKKKKAKARKKAERPQFPRAGQPREPAEPVAGGQAVDRKTALEREIDTFLKKTLGGEQPKDRAAPRRSPSNPPTPPQKSARRRPPQQQHQPPPKRPQTPFPKSESVEDHVQRHMAMGGVQQRDAHLGEQIGLADERLESHLQQVFQHELGSLGRRVGGGISSSIGQGTDALIWQQAGKRSAVSQEIFRMLASPQDIRAAMVLSEILRRPDERWSG